MAQGWRYGGRPNLASDKGTPQGGLISPLLANVYLHYVLDLWFVGMTKTMDGSAHLVRYADDAIVGLQHEHEAREFHEQLRKRMQKYGLELHPEKTHLLRFGKFARRDCLRDGRRRPETFDFLGLTHISGVGRGDSFRLIRRASRKKRQKKMKELKTEIRKRKHWKLPDQWRWLSSVLQGHYLYYGVSGKFKTLASFRRWVRRTWHSALQRRSQRARMTRVKLNRLDQRFPLPNPRIRRRELTLDLNP
jgi:RNA-directed DNA polymerase